MKTRPLYIGSPQVPSRPGTSGVMAVLLPLCQVEGELSLLYTLHCLSMAAYAGEISFPGGMGYPADRD